MTRVLMTADAVGGVWTFALELARAWGPAGARITLAVLGPPPSTAQAREARAVPGLDLRHRPGRLEWMADPWDDVREAGDWLLGLERRCGADVVHLNGYCHGALPWRAPVVMTAPSCVVSWWRAVHGCDPPSSWRRYAAEVACGLRAASLVTAPTAAMLADIQACHGPLPHVVVIPNGRDPEPVMTPRAGKEPLVLLAGRFWDEAKNVTALCAVAPRLAWPVVVAGAQGDGRPAGAGGIRCVGPLEAPALAAWMHRAAIYALPARYEPFGLSALEAAQAGCALVLGDLASLREVWGAAALYVPPADHDALAAALTRLIDDERLRGRMARRAAGRAAAFPRERMAAGYAAVYDRLIATRAGAGRPVAP
jgi:glycogen synthase